MIDFFLLNIIFFSANFLWDTHNATLSILCKQLSSSILFISVYDFAKIKKMNLNPLIPLAMVYIVLLFFFYKDGFGIK